MNKKNTDFFTYTQINPLHRNAGDCVVRAIAIAFGKSWYDVYDELTALGREMADLPNVSQVYSAYIEQHGGIKISPFKELEGGRKRLTAKDLAKTKGTFIISTAHHLATVRGHRLMDTWDSSDKSAYKVWRII